MREHVDRDTPDVALLIHERNQVAAHHEPRDEEQNREAREFGRHAAPPLGSSWWFRLRTRRGAIGRPRGRDGLHLYARPNRRAMMRRKIRVPSRMLFRRLLPCGRAARRTGTSTTRPPAPQDAEQQVHLDVEAVRAQAHALRARRARTALNPACVSVRLSREQQR
mgnify:CR=1 FL=1